MTPEALVMESLFMISNKDREDVNFTLNPVQRKLDNNLTGRDIIPKARQEGVSAYFLGRYTASCIMNKNTRAVVVSHEQESTQRMLNRVKYFIDNIRGPKPIIKNNSANEITFPKMNSAFYIGTAGARKFGRGDMITHLHCSEYAYWPNTKDLTKGLFQAVPASGEIAIESTGNGMNDYATRCLRAAKTQSRYKLHFFNWQDFPEYTEQVGDEEAEEILASLDPSMEEDKLVGSLTPGQIKWRRGILEEMDYDLRSFKQEYPMTLDECFQAAGKSIFYRVQYQPTDEWQPYIGDNNIPWKNSWVLKGHPNMGYTYVIGSDVAAGVERDSSTIEVICVDTMEQVGEFDSNRIEPDVLAFEIAKWGHLFNDAYVVVEQNNHGLVTLAYLRDKYPVYLIHTQKTGNTSGLPRSLAKMGLKTTARTKPLMLGRLRHVLADEVIIHSELLMNQLTTFIETDEGKLEASAGCHDDLVIAAACAVWGLDRGIINMKQKIEMPKFMTPDPFSFEEIIKELRQRGGAFPISPQHGRLS